MLDAKEDAEKGTMGPVLWDAQSCTASGGINLTVSIKTMFDMYSLVWPFKIIIQKIANIGSDMENLEVLYFWCFLQKKNKVSNYHVVIL